MFDDMALEVMSWTVKYLKDLEQEIIDEGQIPTIEVAIERLEGYILKAKKQKENENGK